MRSHGLCINATSKSNGNLRSGEGVERTFHGSAVHAHEQERRPRRRSFLTRAVACDANRQELSCVTFWHCVRELAEAGELESLRGLGTAALHAPDRHDSYVIHWAAGSGQLATLAWLVGAGGMDPV